MLLPSVLVASVLVPSTREVPVHLLPSHVPGNATRAAALALAGVVALGACSDGAELDLEGLAPGTCTDLAPTLMDIDETLRQVANEQITAQEAEQRLEAAQDAVKATGEAAQDRVGASVTELVTRIGFYRIAVDSNNYDGSQDAAVQEALSTLAADCRTG